MVLISQEELSISVSLPYIIKKLSMHLHSVRTLPPKLSACHHLENLFALGPFGTWSLPLPAILCHTIAALLSQSPS